MNGPPRAQVKLDYSERYQLAGHAFDTTRKAEWIVELLAREPVAGVVIQEPADVSIEALSAVHDPRYIAAVRTGKPIDLCIYNAGMDPHENCNIRGLTGITTAILVAREHLVFGWCRDRRVPIVFVLAGGYTGGRLDQMALAALHRLTIEQAASTSLQS